MTIRLTIEAQTKWNDSFKEMREKILLPWSLFLAKQSLRNENKQKAVSDKQGLRAFSIHRPLPKDNENMYFCTKQNIISGGIFRAQETLANRENEEHVFKYKRHLTSK